MAPASSQAQLLGVDLQFAGDSSWTNSCSVPDTVFLLIWGSAGGYQSTDSLHFEINFGDGTDTSYYLPMTPNGSIYFTDYFAHIFILPGAYQVQYIVTGPDGDADTLTDQVLVGTSCGDISGKLYLDADNDCLYDPGELPVQWTVRAMYNGSEIAMSMSDANGDYYLHVPAGFTYTVELVNSNFNMVCPTGGNHLVATIPSTGNDFALLCTTQTDLAGNIYGQGFRPGISRTFHVQALNHLLTCTPPNATVTVTLDPMLSYDGADSTPVSVVGQTIVFNAGQLATLSQNQWMTGISATASLSTNIGDSLCVTVTVDPVTGDANPADNTVTVCLPVQNSFDPNEKQEAHVGTGTGVVAPGTELDYIIFFQNLGNDDAWNINIIDELDADLDLSTLRITGASHDYAVMLTGNTLKFEFNDIFLPAASVDEPGSHGFVSYSIYPKAGLTLGTAIDNYADIYFDFNPAIVTNTVTDIVDLTVGMNEVTNSNSLHLYPNPASDYFVITTGNNQNARLTVYDLAGKMVIETREVSDKEKISLRGLQPGFYQVVLNNGNVIQTGKLTVK
jgi:uncharacterized repeat protein (TIGR01451 family)